MDAPIFSRGVRLPERVLRNGWCSAENRINADPAYGKPAIAELAGISGFSAVSSAALVEASWDLGGFVMFSGARYRRYAAQEPAIHRQVVSLRDSVSQRP